MHKLIGCSIQVNIHLLSAPTSIRNVYQHEPWIQRQKSDDSTPSLPAPHTFSTLVKLPGNYLFRPLVTNSLKFWKSWFFEHFYLFSISLRLEHMLIEKKIYYLYLYWTVIFLINFLPRLYNYFRVVSY